MKIEVQPLKQQRLFVVHHTGRYQEIGKAFQQLHAIATAKGILTQSKGMLGVYFDDPDITQTENLRSAAALIVPDELACPEELDEVILEGGQFLCGTHIGPYTGLAEAWTKVRTAWKAEQLDPAPGRPSFEIYLNAPGMVPEQELQTLICIPVG